MTGSIADIAAIARRANTLAERLRAPANGTGHAGALRASEPNQTLERWRRACAGDHESAWARRLEWDELDERALAHALASEPSADDAHSWGEILDSASRFAADSTYDDLAYAEPLSAQARIPFSQLLSPFVRAAADGVDARTHGRWRRLDASVRDDFVCGLASTLALIAQQALMRSFLEYRMRRTTGAHVAHAVLLGALRTDRCRLYRSFINDHLGDGFAALFGTYPVLGRLLATQTEWWIENTTALLEHLVADWATLRATLRFTDEDPVAALRKAEVGLSDPHRHARSVSILTFASGARIVHKPRSLAIERSFFGLVEWANAVSGGLALRTLVVLDRDDYGWVEHATPAPCVDLAGVERYYERAGMLLCLAYVIGASDLHAGNVHACGDQPVFIDLEVLFSTLISNGSPLEQDPRRNVLDSVMYTALLPFQSGTARDLLDGGFYPRHPTSFTTPSIRHVNTDAMSWGETTARADAAQNAPIVDGALIGPAAYRRRMQDGFQRMYEAIVAHREQLLAEDGPLAAFGSASVRILFRGTTGYSNILRRSLTPALLESGDARSIELDSLKRSLLVRSSRPLLWSLWAEEQRELEACDYPVFYARPASTSIWSGTGAEVPNALASTGYDAVAARIRAMSPADCRRQRETIRLLLANGQRHERLANERVAGDAPRETASDPFLWAIDEAVHLADVVIESHVEGEPGEWLGSSMPGSPIEGFREIGASLFDGTSGIALFYAALARCTDRTGFRELSLDALTKARGALATDPVALADVAGIGAGLGMGGITYVLTRCATLLDDSTLLGAAHRAADTITRQRIEADGKRDLLGGAAGAIVGLLALYDATGDRRLLERAMDCGRHLSRHQLPAGDEYAGHWLTDGAVPQTGFAHGTAGIVASLARLWRVTKDRAMLDAVHAGAAALASAYDPEARDWCDRVDGSDSRIAGHRWCSWCRGATGIGFSLLATAGLPGVPDGAAQLNSAIDASLAPEAMPRRDHLCCGTAGRIELVLTAGMCHRRADWIAAARDAATAMRNGRRANGYSLGLPMDLCPTFFQGLSGIGYFLLRIARPADIPSVLLWQ